MATNHYFDHYQNKTEQNLIEDLTIEAIKIYGMDVNYIPRETIDRDNILGDDLVSQFNDNQIIEMYLESVDGWDGQGDILLNFGLQINDKASLIVSKRRFQEVLYYKERPLEGDLIYIPLTNTLFEINHVEHENPFYQIGKLHTYKLSVELFTYSHEEFNTGNQFIDSINDDRDDELLIQKADNIELVEKSETILNPNSRKQDHNVSSNAFDENNPFGDF